MKPLLRPIRTLLVDLDGTLLGSYDPLVRLEFITRCLWRLRRYGGLKTSIRALQAVTRAVENPQDDASRAMLNGERGAQAFAAETGLPLAEADRVLREEVAAVFPQLERYFFPVTGAREFIEWARPRYRLILATNPVWPIAQVELRLGWAGIRPDVFASITHSGRMHACKPSVDYYRELLAQEGLDAADCALVGDDVRKDLPATQVGIPVFILAPGRRALRRAEQALQTHSAPAQAALGSYAQLRQWLEGAV